MIMICQEIKEVKTEGKKYYICRLALDSAIPQNSGYKAAILEFASPNRLKDVEPGEYYTIKRIPFVSVSTKQGDGKVNQKIKNRIMAEIEEEEVDK